MKGKIRTSAAEILWGAPATDSRPWPADRRRQWCGSGFTLLELLCVLTLLGLMLGLVAPNLYRSWQREEAKAGARQLLLQLKQARSLAVAQGRTVKVIFDLEQNTYQWEKAGVQKSAVLLRGRDSALVWQGTAQQQGYVAFYSDGSSSGGHLRLQGPDNRDWLLIIDKITGQVRLQDVSSPLPRS